MKRALVTHNISNFCLGVLRSSSSIFKNLEYKSSFLIETQTGDWHFDQLQGRFSRRDDRDHCLIYFFLNTYHRQSKVCANSCQVLVSPQQSRHF